MLQKCVLYNMRYSRYSIDQNCITF